MPQRLASCPAGSHSVSCTPSRTASRAAVEAPKPPRAASVSVGEPSLGLFVLLRLVRTALTSVCRGRCRTRRSPGTGPANGTSHHRAPSQVLDRGRQRGWPRCSRAYAPGRVQDLAHRRAYGPVRCPQVPRCAHERRDAVPRPDGRRPGARPDPQQKARVGGRARRPEPGERRDHSLRRPAALEQAVLVLSACFRSGPPVVHLVGDRDHDHQVCRGCGPRGDTHLVGGHRRSTSTNPSDAFWVDSVLLIVGGTCASCHADS